jgi:hypothetical protein
LENGELKGSKLNRKELGELFVRFRKEYPDFDDLLKERDKIVGIIETHSITVDALKIELKKWDNKIGKEFQNLRNRN